MRATRLIGQTAQAAGLIAFTPCRDSLTCHAEPLGHLTHGCAVVDLGDSTQTDLDRDTRGNIGISLRNLWIDHDDTVAGAGCPSTMSR